MDNIRKAFDDAVNVLSIVSSDAENIEMIKQMADKVSATFRAGNKVLICGNGGSATDAMHFAEEFTGQFRDHRRALPAIALSDASHITCVGNDYGFAEVFARGVEAFGKKGDLLIGLSTSGNSVNIIRAVEQAENQEVTTILLLGKDGGKLAKRSDLSLIVPGQTSDRIQEIHMLILHIIIEIVERELFPENYK